MFQFPFGTMHQLNLDWFLQQWQQLRQDWIDEEQHIEDSMQDVYDARDAAIQAKDAAIQAKDDAISAKNDAESAQAGVHADALMAEGFAVGEQNGTPVGPGSPYYQVNAKFYSTNAGTYRYLSEAYARGTMGGTPVDPGDAGYEDNAKYYKEQADLDAQSASDDAAFAAADALKAEGYAVGEQNGTPVSSGSPYYHNNAKYWADDAASTAVEISQDELRIEGMTYGTQNGVQVDSSSPYYENNAEYYNGEVASVVAGLDKYPYPRGGYLAAQYLTDKDYTFAGRKVVVKNNKISLTKISNNATAYKINITGTGDRATYQNMGSDTITDKDVDDFVPMAYNAGSLYYFDMIKALIIRRDSNPSAGTTRFFVSLANIENGVIIGSKDFRIIPGSFAESDYYIDWTNYNYIAIYIGSGNSSYELDGILEFERSPAYTRVPKSAVADYYRNIVTANKNYSVNNLVFLDDKLYKITQNVANGSDFIPGTNCTETTLGAIITQLLNA